MKKVGYGVFDWPRNERVSNRYGFFGLRFDNMSNKSRVEATLDIEGLREFMGKWVRVTAKVVNICKSTHCGDLFLGIFPVTPKVGAEIVVGIGTLNLISEYDYAENCLLGLVPEDKRQELWLDPYKLYNLHNQFVELYIEETKEPAEAMLKVDCSKEEAYGTGDGIQIKHRDINKPIKVPPNITNLGDGMFVAIPQDNSLGKALKLLD